MMMSNSEKIEPVVNNSSRAIVTLAELSYDEERELLRLERIVEQAFYRAGSALAKIRDQRLSRSTHETFESYCQARFNFSRQAANYLIAGAKVYENLETNGCQILPTKERQVRAIACLDSEKQNEVWKAAVNLAKQRVPSSRIVKLAAQGRQREEGRWTDG